MNRAFTLIELLVVIAIISILSAVVLISLGETRNRAKQQQTTPVKAELHSPSSNLVPIH